MNGQPRQSARNDPRAVYESFLREIKQEINEELVPSMQKRKEIMTKTSSLIGQLEWVNNTAFSAELDGLRNLMKSAIECDWLSFRNKLRRLAGESLSDCCGGVDHD